MTSKDFLKVGLYNPGSLGQNHDELVLAVMHHSIDILAINETWLRPNEEEKAPCLPGYSLRSVPRPSTICGGRGGGVAFYVRKGIRTRVCEHPVCLQVEQMWLRLHINGRVFILGTAYRPPWLNTDVFLNALTESVNSLGPYDKLTVLGDFNIDLLTPNNANYIKFMDFTNLLGLSQIVTSPTHYTEYSETLIDVVCTDVQVRNILTKIIGSKLANHAFIVCEMNVKKPKIPPKLISFRPLKDIDHSNFDRDVEAIPWHSFLNMHNVSDMVNSFNISVLNLLDCHAPSKSMLIKHYYYPWITETVKLMMSLRNEAHLRYLRSKKDTHKEYFKQLKTLVNATLHHEKRAYFRQYIDRHTNDPKTLWKNLKLNVLPPKTDKDLPNHLCCPEEINSHFLNLPGSKDVFLSNLTYYEFHSYETKNSSSTFHLKCVNQQDVLKIINSFKSNAQGADLISLDMLSLTLPNTLGIITSIVNRSIITCTFPEPWKTAIVRPLPKNANPLTFQDLRPISILPCLSKVMERVVYLQVIDYLETNNILPHVQSGFRKGRSTSTALLDVTNNILEAQDAGLGTLLVLLDFSRAFDTINISLLLSKLSFYGFDIPTVKWFESYLSDRYQYVEVRNSEGTVSSSSLSTVTRGVPQGSILGPLLFILYSADIIGCIRNCNYHLYADDLQLYLSCHPNDVASTVDRINDELNRIVSWSSSNCLVLNPVKSKFMILGSKLQVEKISSKKPDIRLGGEAIAYTREARNLGVVIDSELRFETHVKELARNCFYRLKVLYRIRKHLSTNVRIKLVESLVLSKFNYAAAVYGPRLLARTKALIQRVQNACTRYCFNVPPRSHVSPYINQGKILNMASRRYIQFATLLFGIIKNRKPLYLYEKLTWSSRARTASQLVVPPHKTKAFKGTFKYAATKIWNNIPPPLRNLSSVNAFKSKLKEYIFELQLSGKEANCL